MDLNLRNYSSKDIALSAATLSGYCCAKQYWKAAETSLYSTGYRIIHSLLSIPILGLFFLVIERICVIAYSCCFKVKEADLNHLVKKPLAKRHVIVKYGSSISSSDSLKNRLDSTDARREKPPQDKGEDLEQDEMSAISSSHDTLSGLSADTIEEGGEDTPITDFKEEERELVISQLFSIPSDQEKSTEIYVEVDRGETFKGTRSDFEKPIREGLQTKEELEIELLLLAQEREEKLSIASAVLDYERAIEEYKANGRKGPHPVRRDIDRPIPSQFETEVQGIMGVYIATPERYNRRRQQYGLKKVTDIKGGERDITHITSAEPAFSD